MSFPGTIQTLNVNELTVTKLSASTGNFISKQGAVVSSDFTRSAASYANVTGCEVVTGGPAMLVVAAQVVAASSVTTAQLKVVTSAGAITGAWQAFTDTASAGDVTLFGSALGATGPNLSSAATYEVQFVGWVSAAATVDLQGQSDGTRTLTVKVGSMIASSI